MQFSTHRNKKRILINITSLIDVLFLLLIFFIVSSTFQERPALTIDLPEASRPETEQEEQYSLFIDKDQRVFINKTEIHKDSLHVRLRALAPLLAERGLMIKADKGIPYGLIIRIMDTAKTSGIDRLMLATDLLQE